MGFLKVTPAWKVSKYGVFSGPCFPAFKLNAELNAERYSVFSLNAGKYRPQKPPYLDTFNAVNMFTVCVHLSDGENRIYAYSRNKFFTNTLQQPLVIHIFLKEKFLWAKKPPQNLKKKLRKTQTPNASAANFKNAQFS